MTVLAVLIERSCGFVPALHSRGSQIQATRCSTCMNAAPEGSNNIIPITPESDSEVGDAGIKVEVFARPPPPPDRIAKDQNSIEALKAAYPDISADYWGECP